MTTLEHISVDTLTGLPTHETFLAQMEEEVKQAESSGSNVSMGLIDLDLFGKVNSQHGTEIGDGCLKALSNALRAACAEPGTVYRYGGDAFSVLLEIEKEEAFLFLERFRQSFDHLHDAGAAGKSVKLPLTVSIGVAAFPDDGNRAQEIVRKANEALYRAKVSGRNKVCLAREEKMVTKTSHYAVGQLEGLSRLAKREGIGEAVLLREALDDLLRKYNS